MAVITPDTDNPLFRLATEFVSNTSRHIFLTGKAGTGKTTFLRYIKEHTHKNVAVAAPTGVAAINAGGVTLHSLFQLPFGPFIPANNPGFSESKAADANSLIKQLRLNSNKRQLIQELDLLIIDEVSMLRADMLDAIDSILRHVRRNHYVPYGGLQVLFIGDLYQLPPVVQSEEWNILKPYYPSPFFFHAKVIEQAPPLYIELKKIYRQNEQHFIDILNRIRNNRVEPQDLNDLNKRQLPNPNDLPNNIITLTTHNKKADSINNAELNKLPGKLYTFEGVINNEFNENALPTDRVLQLKEGAQVMFIRNDSGEDRKFFNGKLATVSRISHSEIYLLPAGEQDELKLEKETWENIRYTYNKEKDRIEEEELGSFIQYPIRLAWAITIHKSQGLTFERAVIDTGQAFAAGQVYVALSRCTSLQGLYLLSPIYASAIQTDPLVIAFAEKEHNADELGLILESEKKTFIYTRLRRLLEWNKLIDAAQDLKELVSSKQFAGKEELIETINQIITKTGEQKQVAEKFDRELQNLAVDAQINKDMSMVQQRVSKAFAWFTKSIFESLILPLHEKASELESKSKVKLVLLSMLETSELFWKKIELLQGARFPEFDIDLNGIHYSKQMLPVIKLKKKGKAPKGSSQRESLELFLNGKSVAEIAEHRGLVQGTIHSHLAEFVLTGEISASQLISEERIKTILSVISDDTESSAAIKEKLGPEISFNDIRIVLNHRKRLLMER